MVGVVRADESDPSRTTAASPKIDVAEDAEPCCPPSNNHAVVLVSSMNLATMRALGYAKSTDRPGSPP